MTPQYVAVRVEVRERTAHQHYITCRTMYRAHQWSDAEMRARRFREAVAARTAWSMLNSLLREPSRVERFAMGIDLNDLATMAGVPQ